MLLACILGSCATPNPVLQVYTWPALNLPPLTTKATPCTHRHHPPLSLQHPFAQHFFLQNLNLRIFTVVGTYMAIRMFSVFIFWFLWWSSQNPENRETNCSKLLPLGPASPSKMCFCKEVFWNCSECDGNLVLQEKTWWHSLLTLGGVDNSHHPPDTANAIFHPFTLLCKLSTANCGVTGASKSLGQLKRCKNGN